jgi:hypothetical protein
MLANLIVDWSHDLEPARDIEAVARSTVEEFDRIFPADPPAGERPIHVFYRPEGPITDSTKDTNVYRIGLTVRDRFYDQLAFQLGHELCHIIADPRRTNWFVESCCEMVSLVLLRRMSKVWACTPPFRNWVDYAPNFEEYAQNRIREATTKVFQSESLPDQAQVHKWLASVSSSFRPCPLWRERNVLIAEMLRPVFEESADNWDALRFLAQASAYPPVSLTDLDTNSGFEFGRWLRAVPEHLKELVRRISDMFENETSPNSG